MKCEVKFSEVKQALKAMTALRSLGKEADSENVCLLTVVEENEGELLVESTYMGAYLKIRIPCKTLRPGSIGVSTAMLSKCRLAAMSTIDYKKGTLSVSAKKTKTKTKYELQTEQNVDKFMADSRPSADDSKPIARIPFRLWKQGAETIAFQTGLKEKEPLEVQVSIRKGRNGGVLEMAGIDNYGFAYFERSDQNLKLKNECEFVIQSILLSKVVSTLPETKSEGDEKPQYVVMGLTYRGEIPTLVRFRSENFDFFHPTINQDYQDISERMEFIESGKRDTSFIASQKDLLSALKDVLAFGKSNKDIVINLNVADKGVTMQASMDGNNANTIVKTGDIEKVGQIAIFDNYFESFLKSSPPADLKMEQWGNKFVLLRVQGMEGGRIEFLASRPQ
jgi:hypothetical protein